MGGQKKEEEEEEEEERSIDHEEFHIFLPLEGYFRLQGPLRMGKINNECFNVVYTQFVQS